MKLLQQYLSILKDLNIQVYLRNLGNYTKIIFPPSVKNTRAIMNKEIVGLFLVNVL